MGLNQEFSNINRDMHEARKRGGIGSLVYGFLFFCAMAGVIIAFVGGATETYDNSGADTKPAAYEDSRESAQPAKTVKVTLTDNYYMELPEVVDLKSEEKDDSGTTKTYYFFGKEDKSTLLSVSAEKEDGEFPQVVWERNGGSEDGLHYASLYDTAVAIREEEEKIELWWPDGRHYLCHVKLTGGNIDGYTDDILDMIGKTSD